MNGRGRQFFRGGVRGQGPPRRRRYQNDYTNNNNFDEQGPLPTLQQQHQQPPTPLHNQHHHSQQQQQQQPIYREHNNPNRKVDELSRLLRDQKIDIDELRSLFSKLNTELEQVKARLAEYESSGPKVLGELKEGGDQMQDDKDKKRKLKFLKQREKKALKLAQKRGEISSEKASQQAQPTELESSGPTVVGEPKDNGDQTHDDKDKKRKFKLLKQREKKAFRSAHKRGENISEKASERAPDNAPEKASQQASENASQQAQQQKNYEFALSILDHAICDVTSPTKLSEIANNLYQLLVSDDNNYEVDFKQGFYDALNDISKREDDIAIDAPRYMDTLGQVLADCLVPMFNRHKGLLKDFLNRCIESYCQQNRAVLLASIMKSIASIKSERSAKEIWDAANMDWSHVLNEGTDLSEFLESHEVTFTTQAFSPEPKVANKKTPKELEKFADDVTSMVERHCTPQALEDLVRELNLEAEDQLEYSGTLVYAIVRGCLITDSSSDIKLNNEALNKYSTLMNGKNEVSTKTKDAVALHALGALTKLWHQYNCPQDLFRTILVSLHSQGVASYGVLATWLNSESMNNIPGIGAARLNSKRYIEDLGATIKAGAGM